MRAKSIIFFLFLIAGLHTGAQDIPQVSNPPQLVNDFYGALSAEEKTALEQKLVSFNDSTSTQIAIVLIKSSGEYPIDDYAVTLYRTWGIGQKGKDNGAVILCAMDDRRVAIITGYGLEGALPDAICKRIIEQKIKPAFKEGQYYTGLDAATDEMIKRTSGEYVADEKEYTPPPFQIAPFIIFGIIVLVVFYLRYRSVKRYALLNGLNFWTAWTILNAARNVGRSRNSSWGSGWGSSSWGGGGFGGFGGGSTGGGGASGGW